MISWASEDQQSGLGAWALLRTQLRTNLSFFSRRCFKTSLKVSAMEEGADLSIWDLGSLFSETEPLQWIWDSTFQICHVTAAQLLSLPQFLHQFTPIYLAGWCSLIHSTV